MKPSEANKIIAEYMGQEFPSDQEIENGFDALYDALEGMRYAESLDALVPVWEKLDNDGLYGGICIYSCIIGEDETFTVSSNLDTSHGGFECDSHEYGEGSATIQEAAAIATAKAIKELK